MFHFGNKGLFRGEISLSVEEGERKEWLLKISYTKHVTLVLPGQCSWCHNWATDWKTGNRGSLPQQWHTIFPLKCPEWLCLTQASVQCAPQ